MTEPEQLQPPQQDEAPREPKIIKRYTNRKLYDTVESRYVTLDEIAEMIKQGAEVKIVDNRTKDDLTSVTLAQIIFEEEKKKNQMPLSVLREIIRHPGDALSGFIQKEVTPRVASIREEAETRLDRLLRREEGGTGELKDDLLRAGQRTIEEWQRRADDRVKSLVEGVTGSLPALGSDLGNPEPPSRGDRGPAGEARGEEGRTPDPGLSQGCVSEAPHRLGHLGHHLRAAAPGRVIPDRLPVALGLVDGDVDPERRRDPAREVRLEPLAHCLGQRGAPVHHRHHRGDPEPRAVVLLGHPLHRARHLGTAVQREIGERHRDHHLGRGDQHRGHAQPERGRAVEHHHVVPGRGRIQPLAEPLRGRGRIVRAPPPVRPSACRPGRP